MDQAEGQRWSRIIGKEADAMEASRPPPAISQKTLECAAVRIVLADELAEVDEILQQFAEAVKTDFLARHFGLASKRTARWTNGPY